MRAVLEMGGLTRESAEELEVFFCTFSVFVGNFSHICWIIFSVLFCIFHFFCSKVEEEAWTALEQVKNDTFKNIPMRCFFQFNCIFFAIYM